MRANCTNLRISINRSDLGYTHATKFVKHQAVVLSKRLRNYKSGLMKHNKTVAKHKSLKCNFK